MNTQEKLNSSFVKLGNGYHYILSGILDNYESNEQQIIEHIFNGYGESGTALERYQLLFEKSFDEEVSEFDVFLYEFIDYVGDPVKDNNNNNNNNILRGFALCKETTQEIVELSNEFPEVKKELKNLRDQSGLSYLQFYSPVEFHNRFKGWSRSFHKELKDALGRRAYEKVKQEID
jgi:hypothetical protein